MNKILKSVVLLGILYSISLLPAAAQAANAPCLPLTLASRLLAPGSEGTAYLESLQIFGGVSPVAVMLQSGLLPPGIKLSPSGELAGIPSSPGSYEFTVTAVDACKPMGQSATAVLSIFVNKKGEKLSGPEQSVVRKPPLKVSTLAYPDKVKVAAIPDSKTSIRYTLTAQPAETATMESPGGSFVVNGSVAETISAPMTAVLVNGTGEVGETVNLSKRVLDFARRENADKIIFSRAFIGRRTTTIAVVEFTLAK
jgi:hypothetical protein